MQHHPVWRGVSKLHKLLSSDFNTLKVKLTKTETCIHILFWCRSLGWPLGFLWALQVVQPDNPCDFFFLTLSDPLTNRMDFLPSSDSTQMQQLIWLDVYKSIKWSTSSGRATPSLSASMADRTRVSGYDTNWSCGRALWFAQISASADHILLHMLMKQPFSNRPCRRRGSVRWTFIH